MFTPPSVALFLFCHLLVRVCLTRGERALRFLSRAVIEQPPPRFRDFQPPNTWYYAAIFFFFSLTWRGAYLYCVSCSECLSCRGLLSGAFGVTLHFLFSPRLFFFSPQSPFCVQILRCAYSILNRQQPPGCFQINNFIEGGCFVRRLALGRCRASVPKSRVPTLSF